MEKKINCSRLYHQLGIPIILLLLLPNVNAQLEESRNFNTCYAQIAGSFQLVNMFSKYTIDLLDPNVKQFITNLCNTYHDKTGQWLDILGNDVNQAVLDEFYEKNLDTIPEPLRSNIENRLLTK